MFRQRQGQTLGADPLPQLAPPQYRLDLNCWNDSNHIAEPQFAYAGAQLGVGTVARIVAYRLYLPKEWAEDVERRKKARVPEEIKFKTKPQIALDQLRAACAAGVPRGVVLDDSSYGSNSEAARRRKRTGAPLCGWNHSNN